MLEDSVARPGRVAERHSENRDARVNHVYSHALNGYAAKIDRDELGAIRQDPTVAYIERDGRGGIASQEVPFGIDRIFATGNETLAIDEQDATRVDANVAVLDTGVYSHPDLNLVGHIDCSGQPCQKGGTDKNGHGTHVAGTVGAIDNGLGVVGVAPGARIWGVKVLGTGNGEGEFSDYIAGIDWVTGTREDEDPENDIDVVNASLRFWCCQESKAFNEALADSLKAGIVHVAAAGNESEDVRYLPGVHPDEITVSALEDEDGKPGSGEGKDPLASFSNFGPPVDIAAPGVGVLSTVPGGGYEALNGTSMASPHVAGAAAILAAAHKPESKEDVEDIRDTLVETGNLDWEDISGDEVQEPLLDVSNEGIFDATLPPLATTKAASGVSPSAASLNATIDPKGFATTYQFEYGKTTSYGSKAPASPKSAGAGLTNMEVAEAIEGLSPSTTYHFRVVATNSNGVSTGGDRTFTTSPVIKPKATTHFATETTGEGATLVGFVNPEGASTTYQFEYGKTTSYGSKIPTSPKGVGSGMSNVEVSEKVSGLEPGSYHYRVVATNAAGASYGVDRQFDVSEGRSFSIACPEAGLCFRVGSFGGTGGGPNTTVEAWDGFQWSQETMPLPEGVMANSAHLRDISCVSSTSCVAVGTYGIEGGATYLPLVERWNGSEWSLSAVTKPAGKGYNALTGVSCTSTSACTAVGLLSDGNPQVHRWNGTSWSTQSFPKELKGDTVYLEDVSCTSASACVAVGVAHGEYEGWEYEGNKTVVGSWNGTSWSLQKAVNPSNVYEQELQSVSCTSASACTAVGSYGIYEEEGSGWSALPLVERWNGSSWTQQSTPSLPGATESYLYGTSCSTSSSCKAVGMSNGETLYGLVESWNGSSWTQQSTPLPEFVWLEDVSCSAAESCVATGFGSGESGWYPVSAAWNGSKWTQMG